MAYERNNQRTNKWQTQLDDLDFADDLALLSHTSDLMQAKTTALNRMSESVGLRIHPANSKVLTIVALPSKQVRVEDQALEDVESFCYLGSIIHKKGGTEAEVKA